MVVLLLVRNGGAAAAEVLRHGGDRFREHGCQAQLSSVMLVIVLGNVV